MAKLVDDSVLDAALQYIADEAAALTVCKDTPTTYGNATTDGTHMLATVAIDDTDFAISNGATGRKTTVAEQAAVAVVETGTATHVCIVSADTLLFVTTCTGQSLTDGNTVTIPAWTITIGDPT